uniref:Uncharacterized protein n=1 Tax=Anguilla anguilla TaxID=7936 RepID=A0A0E9XCH8_ANGAN
MRFAIIMNIRDLYYMEYI